jgi:pimeloyl-ACP methyl ester carboxylesterase
MWVAIACIYFLRVNRVKYRLLALLNRLGLFRLYVLLRGPEATMGFIRRLPAKLQRTVLSGFMRKTFEAAANESAAMEEGIRRAKEMYAVHAPLAIPLVVLSHGIPDMFTRRMSAEESAEAEQRWQKLQAGVASLSSQGKLIVAKKSGHKIHIDEPELVVDVLH